MSKIPKFETSIGSYYICNRSFLGSGGSGEVHKYKLTDENEYAVKIFSVKGSNKKIEERRQKFLQEIRFLKETDHPNILKVLDYLEGPLLFVMPLYWGNLNRLLTTYDEVSFSHKKKIILGLIDALIYSQENHVVLHRDLKLENILIDIKTMTPILADFGIAEFDEEFSTDALTKEGKSLHNKRNYAPEQKLQGYKPTS